MIRLVPLVGLLLVGCQPSAPQPVAPTTPVLTPIESTGWGSLRGQVVWEGEIPKPTLLSLGEHPHKDHCASDQLVDESFVIDAKSRGVANAVIAIVAPAGQFFPPQPDERKTWASAIVIDQPACRFEPHIVVTYPQHYDPTTGSYLPTGQRFLIRNSSPIIHEAELIGSPGRNPKRSNLIPARQGGTRAPELPIELQRDADAIRLSCSLHKWMGGYIWAFDHPYAIRTDSEGRFELPQVPAGKFALKSWHEAGQFIDPPAEVTIPADGTTELKLTLRKKG